MFKRIALIMLASLTIVTPMSCLTGCGSRMAVEDTEDDGTDEDEDDEDASTDESEQESTEEEIDADALITPDVAVSSNVWNIANKTIVFGQDRIVSYDKNSGKSKPLWKDKKKDNDYTGYGAFSAGKGIIVGDKIFFIRTENTQDSDGTWSDTLYLYRMNVDGSHLTSLYQYSGLNTYEQDMAYLDGMLYITYASDKYPVCLRIDDNGDIAETVQAESLDGYDYDVSEYTLPTYDNNGHKYMLPSITEYELGKRILTKNYNTLVVADTDSGNRTEYKDQYPVSIYGDKLLLYHYNSASNNPDYEYGILDLSTEKYKKVLTAEESLRVFAMDDEYFYYCSSEPLKPETDAVYLRCNIGTGEESTLYTVKSAGSELPSVSYWDVVSDYTDGHLYTMLNRDYALSYVGIDTATDEVDYVANRYYDSGISEFGKLIYMNNETEYSGQTMATSSVSILQLDDKYAGASKINKLLKENGEAVIAQVEDVYDECVSWYKDSDGYFIPYSFDNNFAYVSYNDGKIINIIEEGYNYYGGAHGMPYRVSYVFDLNTGERLWLSDLIDVPEDTLEDLVAEYTTKHMNDVGEYYWDDYEETVRLGVNMTSVDFILKDDGVDFFFPPYLLASYASGFQDITVPYDKLNPKFK